MLYIHYEEGDPLSTIERLQALGSNSADIAEHLTFVAPTRPVTTEWLAPLLDPAPVLVIHDGINEAMALHAAQIKDVEGASLFRRLLITPCLNVGAAVLSCDHLPMNADGARRDAYGTVHKGNALNGARILLENFEPFGRGMRGCSNVFITKDRPGELRAHGRPTDVPGKTFMGTLVVDNTDQTKPLELEFHPPRDRSDDDGIEATDFGPPPPPLYDIVYDVLAAQPDWQVGSMRDLFAAVRAAGHSVRDEEIRNAVSDLVVRKRAMEVLGKRGSRGVRAVVATASQDSGEKVS